MIVWKRYVELGEKQECTLREVPTAPALLPCAFQGHGERAPSAAARAATGLGIITEIADVALIWCEAGRLLILSVGACNMQ